MDEVKKVRNNRNPDMDMHEKHLDVPEKRPFVAPTLVRHGDLKDLTKGGGGMVFSP